MSTRTRVRQLERQAGAVKGKDGECGCPNFDVRYYDKQDSEGAAEADTEEAGMCDECGGRKMPIKVIYVESRAA